MRARSTGLLLPRLSTLAVAGAFATCSMGAFAAAPDASFDNAGLYGESAQAMVHQFVQDDMRCDKFGVNGFCVSTGLNYINNVGPANGHNYQGDFDLAYRVTRDWTAGFGYRGPNYHLTVNGDGVSDNANMYGLFVEYGNRLRRGVFARAAIAYQQGDATVGRSYPAGSGLGYSSGTSGIGQRAVSTEAGYVFIISNRGAVMPYLGVDYLRTGIDGYSEAGGQNAAKFSGASDNSVFGTLGINCSFNFNGHAILTAGFKHVQRLNSSSPMLTGTAADGTAFGSTLPVNERWNQASLNLQFEGPAPGSRIDLSYGHSFASSPGVARDVAGVSFTMGF